MEKRVETQEEILNYFSLPTIITFSGEIIKYCQKQKKVQKKDFTIEGHTICKKIPALDGFIYDAYIKFTFHSIRLKSKDRSDFFEIKDFIFYKDTIPDFVLDLMNSNNFLEVD